MPWRDTHASWGTSGWTSSRTHQRYLGWHWNLPWGIYQACFIPSARIRHMCTDWSGKTSLEDRPLCSTGKKTKNKCASDCYRCVYIHIYICISIFFNNFQLRIIGTWTCNFISKKKSLTELQLINHAFEYFVQASAWMINHIASIYSRYLKYIVWTIITQPMRWIYSNDRSWIMAWMINYVQHMVGTVI